MQRALPLLFLSLLFPIACQTGTEDGVATPRSSGESLSIRLTLPADAQQERIEAIGRHVETLADVSGASIQIEKNDDSTAVTIQVWGADLPSPAELETDLRQSFAELASATIAIAPADPADAPPALPTLEDIEDPAEAEKAIRDELEAQGVDGEVKVQIRDDEDGNREVEVRVEKHDEG